MPMQVILFRTKQHVAKQRKENTAKDTRTMRRPAGVVRTMGVQTHWKKLGKPGSYDRLDNTTNERG